MKGDEGRFGFAPAKHDPPRGRTWSAAVGNITLATWFGADVVRIVLFAGDRLNIGWREGAEIGILAFAAATVLWRPGPRRQDASPGTMAVAIGATLMPLLYGVLGTTGQPTEFVSIAQGAALFLMGAALASLGTNFSVLPHYRALAMAGPYRFVRHPLYASYLLFDGALAVWAGSAIGAALWIAEFTLLTDRARREERLLAASDPDYLSYSAEVRYRLVPHIY